MKNTMKCKQCTIEIIYKCYIEESEANFEHKYKLMYYCPHCDSYEFVTIDNSITKINPLSPKISIF